MRFELSGSLIRPDPIVLRFDYDDTFDTLDFVKLGYTHFEVICIGGGGGMGGGIDTANSGTLIRSYGGAGGGGGYQRVRGLLSALSDTCPIVVGHGGALGTEHASNPALTTDGGDGGYSTFNGTTCRASGGKGGKRVQSNSLTVTTQAHGGDGGVGNRTIGGGGAAGGIVGTPSADGPGTPGLDGVDGTIINDIGRGGGGGAGGVGKYGGITCNEATSGGRGAYNPGDISVYGPGDTPDNDLITGAVNVIPGGASGAKAAPLNGLPTVYGRSNGIRAVGDPGLVLIRLTAVVGAAVGSPTGGGPAHLIGKVSKAFALNVVTAGVGGHATLKGIVARAFTFGAAVAGNKSGITSGVSYSVNPFGFDTTVVVDYGLDFKTLSSTTSPVAIGSGVGVQTGTISLPTLTANKVYFYRVRATNQYGQSISDTNWFLTPAVGGTTRHVGSGQTYSTIDAAISACAIGGGDTIVVHTGRYTISQGRTFTGLTRVVRNGTDVVTITRILGDRSNFYVGPGIIVDGSGLADVDDNSIIEHDNTCSNIYYDRIVIAAGESYVNRVNTMMNWHGGISWIWMLGVVSNGGSGMKNYSGSQGNSSDWPQHMRFLGCEIGRAGWDNTHSDGVNDIVYERCILEDPDVNDMVGEHHDGVQVAFGSDVTIRRCIFRDTLDRTMSEDILEQGIILGETSGNWVPGVTIQCCLFRDILGRAIVCQGSNPKIRNVTSYNNVGWTYGEIAYDDFNFGYTGSAEDVKSSVWYMLGLNGGGTTPVLDHCHIEVPNSDSASRTNTTTGTPGFVNAPTNLEPAIGGNLYRSGISDAYSLPWDINGRGWEGTPSKGCYVDANVRTPIVGAAGYTP